MDAPLIGPVIGHTTDTTVRVMAGIAPVNAIKPNTGRIRIRRAGNTQWQGAKKFRFNRTFYYTGVIELTGLTVGTEYEYQVAIIANGTDMPSNADWDSIDIHKFSTRSATPDGVTSFCFGSCLRNNDDGRWGKTLRNVVTQHQNGPLDFMLWLGDQIYNDEYMWLTPNNSDVEDFAERYNAFLNNEYVKKFIGDMPNYMIIDDHEIENSFTKGAAEYANAGIPFLSKNRERLINGIAAVYSYQLSHGPVFDTAPDPNQNGVSFIRGQGNHQTPARHYSSTTVNGVGLFLTDTRKERTKKRFLSKKQEAALIAFLDDTDTDVKLIASSVTFLGDKGKKPNKADNWMKAHKQRAKILKHIVNNNIRNVVFLSGDIHSHYATQLQVDGERLPVYQLVSGSLFWPTGFIMKRIRWCRDDVNWGHIYGAPSNYAIAQPISITNTDFFESNGIGYVEVNPTNSELLFRVFNHSQSVVIEAELPLDL